MGVGGGGRILGKGERERILEHGGGGGGEREREILRK